MKHKVGMIVQSALRADDLCVIVDLIEDFRLILTMDGTCWVRDNNVKTWLWPALVGYEQRALKTLLDARGAQ